MDQQVLFDSGENPKLADPVFRKWWVSAAYLFSEGFRPLVTSAPKERNQRKQKSWDINVAGGILRRGPWSAELQTKNSDQLAKTKTCLRPKSSVLLVRPFSAFDWKVGSAGLGSSRCGSSPATPSSFSSLIFPFSYFSGLRIRFDANVQHL